MEVFIQTVNGKSMTIEFTNSETIEYIRFKMPDQKQQQQQHENKHDEPDLDDPFQIFLKTTVGVKTYTLDVHHSDTIVKVKNQIFENFRFMPDHYSLYFGEEKLGDGLTIADYGIQKYNTLLVNFG